ncbi:hypothetical protein EAI89_22105 [Eubacterium sp. am_0171]|nr:hypothetical protein EAI89_22105 [Eubacterium sp. am_0171]
MREGWRPQGRGRRFLRERAVEPVGEKTGNREGRICFTKTNSVAVGGANASAFGPTAASTLPISCFFSYGFSANGQDPENRLPLPCGLHPSLTLSGLHPSLTLSGLASAAQVHNLLDFWWE